jgi:hypothetical protein
MKSDGKMRLNSLLIVTTFALTLFAQVGGAAESYHLRLG